MLSSDRACEGLTTTQIVELLETVYGPAGAEPRTDPVAELVACILSQHTADANSIPAFDQLVATFPTWNTVVEAGSASVAKVVKKAGLANQKAESIVRSLIEIKRRNGGFDLSNLSRMSLREARGWLESLPGVGPKTASIVLCFSLGMPAIPVDTHVFRLSVRMGLVPATEGAAKAHDRLLRQVPGELAYRFHMAMIRHGRETCWARKPACFRCVLAPTCPKIGTQEPSSY